MNQCPKDYAALDEWKICVFVDRGDARIIYFPFIAVMIVITAVNLIAKKVKFRHKFMANFLVMMGFLEHIALIS